MSFTTSGWLLSRCFRLDRPGLVVVDFLAGGVVVIIILLLVVAVVVVTNGDGGVAVIMFVLLGVAGRPRVAGVAAVDVVGVVGVAAVIEARNDGLLLLVLEGVVDLGVVDFALNEEGEE
eukprot:GEZU01029232.1.p2 GENE.GEZU01029232.1~~GEZU01029232.1.p2  ORF type:complete len:119 (-),score=16.18 GEZU01029232.1:184-540(-)